MRPFVPLTLTSLYALTPPGSATAASRLPQGDPQGVLQQPSATSQGLQAVESPPVDAWWSRAEALGSQLKLWTSQELANATELAGDKIDAFKARVADVASSAKRMSEHISQGEKQEVQDELTKAFDTMIVQMRESTPSPENAQNHNERKELVHRVLETAKEKIVGILRDRTSIGEDVLRRDVGAVCSAVESMVVLGGDTLEQYPVLTRILFIILSMLLCAFIPESFILQPLLRLFGFGPLGPIKGSAAAWAQRTFWGAAVTKGSWFAVLQRAGMTGVGWLSRPLCALFGGMITSGSTWQLFGGRKGDENATAGGNS